MPRRKNDYISDGSDSDDSASEGSEGGFNSQDDEDSKAERRLFEHSSRKRRKVGGRSGKEQAWEGVFGEDEDGPWRDNRGLGSRRGGRGGQSSGRTDWTKAPAFVSRQQQPMADQPDPQLPEERAADDGERIAEESDDADEDEDDDESEEDDDDTPAKGSPRVREDDYDDSPAPRSGLGGLGFANAAGLPPRAEEESETKPSGGRGGIGSSKRGGRGGIGSSSRAAAGGDEAEDTSSRPTLPTSDSLKGGLGSAKAPVNPIEDDANAGPSIPTAFGRKAKVDDETLERAAGSSFKGRGAAPSFAKPSQLTAGEAAHFKSIESNFGAKMLANLGWSAGEGLGKDRSGRAVPVAVGKVLRGQGLQSGMRTEDSKREARRRGEAVSDEEEERPRGRGGRSGRGGRGGAAGGVRQEREEREQSWKKQRKVKVKVEHKTYEQLLAEAGDNGQPGVGLVLDARGGDLKEVQSLSSLSISNWTPSSDVSQLQELRHNLRLIVDVTKGDVEALAREGKTVNERRRWALREEQLAKQRIDETSKRVARLQRLQSVIADISSLATKESIKPDPGLHVLDEQFNALLSEAGDEYKSLALDEVIVGAIAQVLRRAFSEWEPFDLSSDALLSSLKRWKKAYNLLKSDDDSQALVTNGYDSLKPKRMNDEGSMTPWESLLWNLWLPKVRSAINNDWSATSPQAAVHLLESWEPILPPFVRDNILEQLVLPKVRTAIEGWDARRKSDKGKTQSLAKIVFPWLPLLGGRMYEVLEEAKRRIRQVLRKWVVMDGVPSELERWKKDIYSSKEWDELMLRNVVPKLGICLRDDFTINPRKQDMVPLEEWVMPWHQLLRSSTFSQLLEVNFFQKFLDTLYVWLIQPNYNPDEVANWFLWWKGRFPSSVLDIKGVSHGFNSAVQLMNEAMQLGSDAPARLRKPTFTPLPASKSSHKASSSTSKSSSPRPVTRPPPDTDITFRNIAEDFAVQNDLIFMPLGRSHGQTGKPLFKVAKDVTSRGVTVYIGAEAVFAQGDEGEFKAVSLDDMVRRAKA